MPFASGNRWLFVWLSSLIVMVITMIIIGGITRVTGSGLSMVEWRPLMGWKFAPLNEKEWLRVFDLYKISRIYVAKFLDGSRCIQGHFLVGIYPQVMGAV